MIHCYFILQRKYRIYTRLFVFVIFGINVVIYFYFDLQVKQIVKFLLPYNYYCYKILKLNLFVRCYFILEKGNKEFHFRNKTRCICI